MIFPITDPAKLFNHESWHKDDHVIRCPICGFDYTHPEAAWTRVGSDTWEAGVYGGAEPVGVTDQRRSALVVVFSCENEHRFALVIQQHKGNNFASVEQLPDVVCGTGDDCGNDDAWDAYVEEGRRAAAERLAEIVRDRKAAHQKSQN